MHTRISLFAKNECYWLDDWMLISSYDMEKPYERSVFSAVPASRMFLFERLEWVARQTETRKNRSRPRVEEELGTDWQWSMGGARLSEGVTQRLPDVTTAGFRRVGALHSRRNMNSRIVGLGIWKSDRTIFEPSTQFIPLSVVLSFCFLRSKPTIFNLFETIFKLILFYLLVSNNFLKQLQKRFFSAVFMKEVEAPYLWRALGNWPVCPFVNPALDVAVIFHAPSDSRHVSIGLHSNSSRPLSVVTICH